MAFHSVNKASVFDNRLVTERQADKANDDGVLIGARFLHHVVPCLPG